MPLAGLFKALGKAAVESARPPKKLILDAEKQAVSALNPVIPKATTEQAISGRQADKIVKDAESLTSKGFREYDLEDSAQPNWDVINTTDEVKAAQAQFGERYKKEIDIERRGVMPDAEIDALSNDTGIQAETLKTVMSRDAGGGIPPPEQVKAARKMLVSSASRLKELSEVIQNGDAGPEQLLQFRKQWEIHQEFNKHFMGLRAEWGRVGRALGANIGDENVPLARLQELSETVSGKDIYDIAKAVSKLDSIQGVNKFAQGYKEAKAKGILLEVFVNSILSGVKTHVVNTTGNALFMGMNLAETGVASMFGKARLGYNAMRGRPLSPEEVTMTGEMTAQLYGMIHGFSNGLRLAGKALRTGEASDQIRKLEMPYPKAISAENLELSGMLGRAADFLGTVIRVPTERLLTAEDDFFKAMAYQGDLSRQAWREAMAEQQRKGLSEEQTADFIRRFVENPPDDVMMKAHDAALYQTFQNPLGPSGLAVQRVINNHASLKVLAPFVRTPTNIFKDAFVERTPLGLFSKKMRAQIAEGGPQRDLALARISMGTLTATTVGSWAASGMITGGGPSDPKARQLLRSTGWQPYSIRMVNPQTGKVTYHSYARAEPLAFIIGATADFVETMQFADIDPEIDSEGEQASKMAASIVAGITENTMSKTFLSGLSRFNEAISDPERYFDSWWKGMAKSVIPYSAFQRDMAKMTDPIMREAFTLGEQIKAQTPGMSKTLKPKLDPFAEIIYHPRGTFLGVVSAYPEKRQTIDPAKLELAKLMEETNSVPVSRPQRRIDGVRLTADEYHDYILTSRKRVTVNGMTFLPALKELMSSPGYMAATPDMKVNTIRNLQNEFNEIAKYELLHDSKHLDLQRRVEKRKISTVRKKYGDEAAIMMEMNQ